MRILLAVCLLQVGMSGQTISTAPMKWYARYGGLLQSQPLTPEEQSADDCAREDDVLMERFLALPASKVTVRDILSVQGQYAPLGGYRDCNVTRNWLRSFFAAPVLSAPLPDRIEDQWQYESCEGSCTPIPEPMDVPAIQSGAMICDIYGEYPQGCRSKGWTCADKSRILETAEDGTKWCRRVQSDRPRRLRAVQN
jgi:hypothetical protein